MTLYRKAKTLALITGLWLLAIVLLAPTPAKVDSHSMIVQGDDLARIQSSHLGINNTLDADYRPDIGCANRTLDADPAGLAHYVSLAQQDEEGDYYIKGYGGNLWNDSYLCKGSYLWKDNFLRNDIWVKPVLINA